jgi:hypothetical protein
MLNHQLYFNRSIDTDGLSTSKTLPLSGNFDSVLCSHVMDVDWDGEKEILIGTYGRQVLIYKQGKNDNSYKDGLKMISNI